MAGVILGAFLAPADAAETLKDAFMEGKPYIDVRYRFEYVEQDGLSEKSRASTIRTRLGYKSGEFKNFSTLVEFEDVSQIGVDNYNDTLNGRADHPVVADVENTELNQAFLQYTGVTGTVIKGGRQAITLDNHRFIGDVGWRQNNQTFDGVTIANTSIDKTTIQYGYIANVNRIFGDDSSAGDYESKSHYVNIGNTATPLGKITGYTYLLDLDEAPAASSATYGLSLSGNHPLNDEWSAKYYGEYAYQEEYGDNTTNYGADYYHIAPAVVWKDVTATVGYEVLGSDNGAIGFSTPLATLHKFNGWADKFLTTPAKGLEDLYVDITYIIRGIKGWLEFANDAELKFQYHNFSAEEGGSDYGDEIGVSFNVPIGKHYYVEARYADYDADGLFTDTQKFILGLGIKF